MSEDSSGCQEFGAFRRLIWPIYRHEMQKLIPMLLMFFLIAFNYNVLRTMKDTLVVTAKSSGAEVIPFIKVWVMFPGAVLMTLLFTRLTNRLTRERVFYVMMSIFLIYFFLFAFILYPNREILHPNAFADRLQLILPQGCMGLIAMFRNWTFTIFYVMSELWGNIILFVLFWGFANQVTKLHEAKRFYGLFGFGANLSGIVAGQVSVLLSKKAFNPHLPLGTNAWEQSMFSLISLVLISGVLTLIVFRYLNKKVLNEEADSSAKFELKKKKKMSLRENFRFLLNSKYLIYITVIVVSYNIVINLVEVVWKSQLRELYPSPNDYNLYINQVSTIIGIVATIAALFVSGNSLRKFGWTTTAMLTPLTLLVTSILFFGLFFFKDNLEGVAWALFGMSPLALVVLAGSVQNILCRGAKYTVFDATKEMAFVPLSDEYKVKGKAAIDGVCNRLGKSGGSMIHQSLLLYFVTFSASAPYVAAVLLVIISCWSVAVKFLGIEFNALTSDKSIQTVSRLEENAGDRLVSGDAVLAEQQAI
ncbi:Npt1/Npt2 family nucleotide transporter [Waddlia chondrophila]|uniref:ADP,ATP carrier protein n=2 Tax=Waddlia chondrophila TaxID=71667 RepID=D6YSJ8_WADCW|nr:Npt1/Npt2 family nucleotide transporter [Waddlia chondrophila]ADI39043.1 putative ADP/ATP translocase [Waddlia chondrophila WSU 86-1044]